MPLRLIGAPRQPLGKTSLLLAGSCAFAVGAVCFVALPRPSYKAHADVEILARSVPGPVTRISPDSAHAAARLLLSEGFKAPAPHLLERLAVATGRARAEDGETRLAAEILGQSSIGAVSTGDRFQVWSEARAARQAASFADALAEGLVVAENHTVARWREARAREAAERVKLLEGEAADAHARLRALAPVVADARPQAASGPQPAELRARLDMIRAILASGGAPLSDRRDVPPSIEGLQNNYLDLQRQLLKARQTLGDRHTTIINLQADLKKASAELLAEWQRLKRVTEAELKAARDGDATPARRVSTGEESTSADLTAARRVAEIADRKLTEAVEAHQALASPGPAYRVVAKAAMPPLSGGIPQWLRLLISGAAGILAFIGFSALSGRRRDGSTDHVSTYQVMADDIAAETDAAAPALFQESAFTPDDLSEDADAFASAEEGAPSSFWDAPLPTRTAMARRVLIATTERGVATLPYALGAAFAAIEIGLKVLIVETERDVPTLSAMAATKAEPDVMTLDGRPRVVLRAEQGDGNLFIAPHLAAEDMTAPTPDVFGDARQIFDLVVIDGGYFEAVTASGWRAEAYQRVGHMTSDVIEETFARAFDATPEDVLDPILVPAVEPPVRAEPPRRGGAQRTRRGLLAAESRRMGSLRRTAGGHR